MGSQVQFKNRVATDFIVIHCAATRPSMDVGVREIRQWHKQRGFFDIGYHFVIRRDGSVEAGRPDGVIGAHVEGYNANSLGICLVGGVPEGNPNGYEANFTEKQMEALKSLIQTVGAKYPKAKLVGHHDLNPGKACPSFNVSKWFSEGILVTSAKG